MTALPMDELKPCPFCGSAAMPLFEDGDMEGYSIVCSSDGNPLAMDSPAHRCPMATFGYKEPKDAIAAWNRRAPQLETRTVESSMTAPEYTCSFCRVATNKTARVFVAGLEAYICDVCVGLAAELVTNGLKGKT